MTEPTRLEGKSLDKSIETKATKQTSGIAETVKVVVQALLIALVVRTLLFQPFNIPSGSMIPTLLIGDYLFVSKYAYGYSNHSLPFSPPLLQGRVFGTPPKRGDVVVFKLPSDGQTDYIKRVIGLPGDRIQMRDGRLYINDELVPREPIAPTHTEDFYGHMTDVPTYKETLPGGVTHTIIEIQGDKGFNDNTQVFNVPPDHYFMMGDNRDNSTDSRVSPEDKGVGYVPFDNLVGRAEIIFFSLDKDTPGWAFWKWPWTVRWSRMFQSVK
ncbi:signal peptidase I [Beijerinckia indica]|uniref:Signal peptidase I n=1 Tax=Beijerinckia indica subsp. indica (strain ATCC 9039 / DSM 1715 / NCIMB 8712) TaxID=395963 RepID=B2II97_BEII9|nr:signal peptidase I [Beijerinckia indica]ACB96051.1 signal peptidase I [Beijerinckia indica subsp. indica ATCC 9039]